MQGPKAIDTQFYGDVTRWFIGTVVNSTGDPLKLGRVQVRIVGIHDNYEIEMGMLPWASVLLPGTEPGILYGRAPRIQNGAQVFGLFIDGKQSQVPLVLGSIPHIVNAQSIQIAGNGDGGRTTTGGRVTPGAQSASGSNVSVSEAIRTAQGNGNSYEEQIFNFFVNLKEYTPAQIAGIVGNLYAESGFAEDVITTERRGDGGKAHGIAQWHPDRWNPFLNWCEANNYNPYTVNAQMRWVAIELDGSESSAKARLLKTTTPEHAAIEIMRKYERPQVFSEPSEFRDPPYDPNGAIVGQRAAEAERVAQAVRIYNAYGGN